MYLLRDGYTPPHQRCAGLLILREGTASGTTATLPQTGDIDKNSKSGFPLSSGMPLETIVVTRSTDREFTATRTQDLDRASETRWYGSWSAVYHQLREWHVDDEGIQSIEHQLTKNVTAVVQTGLSSQ